MHPRRKGRNAIILVGLIVLFPLSWLLLFGVFSKHTFSTLPYYTPSCLKGCKDSTYHLPSFTFQDERGLPYSDDSLDKTVWLAAFYHLNHTHLSEITQLLLNVNFKYRYEPDIRIVVFSTDPARDSLQKIARYIESNTRYNAFPQKWKFLTGDSAAMRSFMRNGFLLNDPEASEDNFSPLTLSAQDHIRPVSYYALFKGWLLPSQPPGCLRDLTSFHT